MGRVHCCVGSHLRAAEVLLTPKLPFSSSAIRFKAGLGFWPCSHVKVISLGVPFNSSFTFTLLPPPLCFQFLYFGLFWRAAPKHSPKSAPAYRLNGFRMSCA